jgi:hypothetical protein
MYLTLMRPYSEQYLPVDLHIENLGSQKFLVH